MSLDLSTSRRTYLRLVGAGAVGTTGIVGGAAAQGGSIPMGSILPITGELSDFGSGMQAAVNLAAEHVNAAGGPLDREIRVFNANSETRPPVAQQRYNEMVNENNIVGFVGAASSGVSTPLAQRVAQDQVMQMSNASTSPALAELGYAQGGEVKYFGRTAPNDSQQGQVMGRILNDDEFIGADTAAFLHVANPYGQGLARTAEESFDGETVSVVSYAQQQSDYSSTLDNLFENDPDAVGFIGYPASGRTILQQWSRGGYGGEWILSEGLNSTEFLTNLSDITAGMYITSPNPETTSGATAFEEAIGEQNTLFAPHAYDALFLQALAMHAGGEASGTAIAQNIRSVSRAEGAPEDATVVTVDEFQAAKEAIDAGEDINYQGASSPVNLNEALEPINQFAIIQVTEDGSTETLQTIPRSFFQEGAATDGAAGNETAGNATAGNATAGNATAGNETAGNGTG